MKKLFVCFFSLLAVPSPAQFNYTINISGVTITRYTGSDKSVSIPATIEGKPVTAIGYEAFFYNTSLINVVIPDSVTVIEDCAFIDCMGLAKIEIPNNVISIGNEAFGCCYCLTNLTIGNSVTSLGDSAFSFCTRLSYVNIPNSVTSIGKYAFYECHGITNLLIGNGITKIEDYAFFYCDGLTNIIIPGSVTAIGNSAFADCAGLTNIAIPNSVVSIGTDAFDGCVRVTVITVGNGVTNIGDGAFYWCSNLKKIFFQGDAPTLDGLFVFLYDDNATVYYSPLAHGWSGNFGGRTTAISPLAAVTTTNTAPPYLMTGILWPINPINTVPSGNLKKWYGGLWQTVTSWSNNGIDTNQPTVVITHGWNDSIRMGDDNGDISWSALIARELSVQNKNANIFGYDWSYGAVSILGQGKIFIPWDIRNEGLKGAEASATRGSIEGVSLANNLIALGVNPKKLQLIGHSNGGAVVGAASSALFSITGQKVQRLTTLDTPNLTLNEIPLTDPALTLTLANPSFQYTEVNAMKHICANTAVQVEVYYSDSRARLGFGEPLANYGATNVFNGRIYPNILNFNIFCDSTYDHIRAPVWFSAGMNWAITSPGATQFTNGNFTEQGFNSHVFGADTVVQQFCANLKKLTVDNFKNGVNWLGQHAQIFMRDTENAVARITSGSDGYLYRNVAIPGNASYLTFDLKVETPNPNDFLTVTISNQVIFCKYLGTADSELLPVAPIFLDNFAGQTNTLLFTLNHAGAENSSVLLDNITFSALPDALQIQFAGVHTNRFGFTIIGADNANVVVETCTNIANPIWLSVATNMLTGGSYYFSDSNWTNYPARFFRARSL